MVEDRVTDGKRVAQLLASELSGRETGRLAAVSVVDADPDADPDPDGTFAYRVAVRDDIVAAVRTYPDAATLDMTDSPDGDSRPGAVVERARELGLHAEDGDGDDPPRVYVESGAAVKRALDALVDGLV